MPCDKKINPKSMVFFCTYKKGQKFSPEHRYEVIEARKKKQYEKEESDLSNKTSKPENKNKNQCNHKWTRRMATT
jgi:hypothetical protein